MRNIAPRPARAMAPKYAKRATTSVAPTSRKTGGGGWLIVLSVLYWLIFYQNLPNFLEGMAGPAGTAASGPVAVAANTFDRFVKVCILAVSVYVIVSRWSLTRSFAKNINPGVAAFLLLAPLSFMWSIEPSTTLLRFVTLACIFLVCFAISLTGWQRLRFQQVAIPIVMFILVTSLVMGMIYPDRITEIGTDVSQRNAWHGITNSKNEFGMMSSIGVIICFNRLLAWEGRLHWSFVGTAIAFTCLILSRSNTSLFATLVGIFFMVLVMRVPIVKLRYSTHVAVAIAATLLIYELVIQDVIPGTHTLLGPIAALMGKDTTFSARTVIWKVIKDHIHLAPYLGTGYAAYWLGPVPTSPSYIFLPLMYFYPTEAHNGYLDVINDLGMVGLMCLLVFLFFYMRQALQLMRFERGQAALYLALLFRAMVMNMSESEWFSRGNSFAVLILAIACLSRGLLEARPAAPSVTVSR